MAHEIVQILDRLTSGPLGGYSYAVGHPHAVTSIGAGTYTASYDAAGNMTCRAPTRATTCSGTPTGAQLTYDNEGRLVAWQNAPTNPTSTTANLYDGAGQRVEQQTVSGGIGTTTVYVGNLEEVSTTGGTTLTTTSYYAGGQRLAQAVNGTLSYLGSDGLGSAAVALDGNGNAQASILYDPYGNIRYANGAMPGSYGFTGQRADGVTGLDDYGARYYDPVAGQFTSADSVADGLDGYGYVGGNPETLSDPSGHMMVAGDGGALTGGGSSGGTTTAGGTSTSGTSTSGGGCYSDANCGGDYSGGGAGTPSAPACGNALGWCGPTSNTAPVTPPCGLGGPCAEPAWHKPSRQQMDSAIQEAYATANGINQALDHLGGHYLAPLLALIALFNPENPLAAGLAAAVAEVQLELAALADLFDVEAGYGADFWNDPHNLVHFRTLVDTAVGTLNAGLAILGAYIGVVTEGLAAGAAGGLIAGAIGSADLMISVANQSVMDQMNDLGYQAFYGFLW